MVTVEGDLLTILVVLALVFAGLAFFLVFGTVVYLCFIYHRSTSPVYPIYDDSPSPTFERRPSVITPSPIPLSTSKPPKQKPVAGKPIQTRRPLARPQRPRVHSDLDSTIELIDSQISDPSFRPEPTTTVRTGLDRNFTVRRTPYPPDIIARDKRMNDHIQFPRPNRY